MKEHTLALTSNVTPTLTEEDLLEMKNCFDRCFEKATDPHVARFQFQAPLMNIASEARSLLARRATIDKTNNLLLQENSTSLQQNYEKLQNIEPIINEYERIAKNDWIDALRLDINLGITDENFLARNGLLYGPRDNHEQRILLWDNNLNLLRPTPGEMVRDCYRTNCKLHVQNTISWLPKLPLENIPLEAKEPKVDIEINALKYLYYETSGSGIFHEHRKDIEQHNQYQASYREEDRYSPAKSIEEILEDNIKESTGEKEVQVTYNPETHQFIATSSMLPIGRTIDPEQFGYVNYQPQKHGSPAHFLVRYGSPELFFELTSPEMLYNSHRSPGKMHLHLRENFINFTIMKEGQLNCACYRLDKEGYPLWARMIARMQDLYPSIQIICTDLKDMIQRNFQDLFGVEILPNSQGVMQLATWHSFRKYYPFLLQNTQTKDNFFHVAFRVMGTDAGTEIIRSLCKALTARSTGLRHIYAFSLAKNTPSSIETQFFSLCLTIVSYFDNKENPRSSHQANDMRAIFISKLNLLHALFTVKNAQGQTPMDIAAEKCFLCQNHTKRDFTFELPTLLNRILNGITKAYKITEYKNVLYRCYVSPDEDVLTIRELFNEEIDESLLLPFLDVSLEDIVNPRKFAMPPRNETDNTEESPFLDIDVPGDGACLFQAIALGLQLNENAKLSSQDLRNVAASHLEYNHELHAANIKAQLTNLFYQNRELPHDDPRKNQFPGIPGAFKIKLINAVKEGIEAEQRYANSEEGINDYVHHMFDPTAWGGDIELGVLADLLHLQFLIYDGTEAIEPLRPFIGANEAPKVHLLFNDNHYGLRIPIASYDFEDVPKKASNKVNPSEESCHKFSRTDYNGICLFRAIALGLNIDSGATLSAEDLHGAAASYMENHHIYSEKLRDQFKKWWNENQRSLQDETDLFHDFPAQWKNKLLAIQQQGEEEKNTYINSQEFIEDFIEHLDPYQWKNLTVLAALLQVQFHLYDDSTSGQPLQYLGGEKAPVVPLLYVNNQYKLRVKREEFKTYSPFTQAQLDAEGLGDLFPVLEKREREISQAIDNNEELNILNKKVRILLRQKLHEIIKGLFAKRKFNETEKPSIFDTLLQSRLCRHHKNARYPNGRQVEVELANILLQTFYHEDCPTELRQFWLLQTFGNDLNLQCKRLKAFVDSVIYHKPQNQSISELVAGSPDLWTTIGSTCQSLLKNIGIEATIGQTEKTILKIWTANNHNIEQATRQLLQEITDSDDIPSWEKKNCPCEEKLFFLTATWQFIVHMITVLVLAVFWKKTPLSRK